MPGKQGAGMGKQSLSRCGYTHSRTRSLQQDMAYQPFQPLHLRAERRLGAANLHCGDTDGAGASDDDEVLQQGEIEHGDIKIVDTGV